MNRPGTTISHVSNLCTGVGGDQKKEFRGTALFLREKGLRGGIKIYCYCIILTKKPKIISIRSTRKSAPLVKVNSVYMKHKV